MKKTFIFLFSYTFALSANFDFSKVNGFFLPENFEEFSKALSVSDGNWNNWQGEWKESEDIRNYFYYSLNGEKGFYYSKEDLIRTFFGENIISFIEKGLLQIVENPCISGEALVINGLLVLKINEINPYLTTAISLESREMFFFNLSISPLIYTNQISYYQFSGETFFCSNNFNENFFYPETTYDSSFSSQLRTGPATSTESNATVPEKTETIHYLALTSLILTVSFFFFRSKN